MKLKRSICNFSRTKKCSMPSSDAMYSTSPTILGCCVSSIFRSVAMDFSSVVELTTVFLITHSVVGPQGSAQSAICTTPHFAERVSHDVDVVHAALEMPRMTPNRLCRARDPASAQKRQLSVGILIAATHRRRAAMFRRRISFVASAAPTCTVVCSIRKLRKREQDLLPCNP
jgi:hypothetical protein